MRAGIAQSKGLSVSVPSNHQRQAEKLGLLHSQPSNAIPRKRTIPKAMQQQRVGSLPLRCLGFGVDRQGAGWVRRHVIETVTMSAISQPVI